MMSPPEPPPTEVLPAHGQKPEEMDAWSHPLRPPKRHDSEAWATAIRVLSDNHSSCYYSTTSSVSAEEPWCCMQCSYQNVDSYNQKCALCGYHRNGGVPSKGQHVVASQRPKPLPTVTERQPKAVKPTRTETQSQPAVEQRRGVESIETVEHSPATPLQQQPFEKRPEPEGSGASPPPPPKLPLMDMQTFDKPEQQPQPQQQKVVDIEVPSSLLRSPEVRHRKPSIAKFFAKVKGRGRRDSTTDGSVSTVRASNVRNHRNKSGSILESMEDQSLGWTDGDEDENLEEDIIEFCKGEPSPVKKQRGLLSTPRDESVARLLQQNPAPLFLQKSEGGTVKVAVPPMRSCSQRCGDTDDGDSSGILHRMVPRRSSSRSVFSTPPDRMVSRKTSDRSVKTAGAMMVSSPQFDETTQATQASSVPDSEHNAETVTAPSVIPLPPHPPPELFSPQIVAIYPAAGAEMALPPKQVQDQLSHAQSRDAAMSLEEKNSAQPTSARSRHYFILCLVFFLLIVAGAAVGAALVVVTSNPSSSDSPPLPSPSSSSPPPSSSSPPRDNTTNVKPPIKPIDLPSPTPTAPTGGPTTITLTRVGDLIAGDAPNGTLGHDVSMSWSGRRVAVAGGGRVFVYASIDNIEWTPLGDVAGIDLPGKPKEVRVALAHVVGGGSNNLQEETSVAIGAGRSVEVRRFLPGGSLSESWTRHGKLLKCGSVNAALMTQSNSTHVALSSDGSTMAMGCVVPITNSNLFTSLVRVYSRTPGTWTLIEEFRPDELNGGTPVVSEVMVSLSSDGSTMAAVTAGGTGVEIFDRKEIASRVTIHIKPIVSGTVTSMTLSGDGSHFAVTNGQDAWVYGRLGNIWDLSGDALGEGGTSVTLSDNGRLLALGNASNDTVRIFALQDTVWVPRGGMVSDQPGDRLGTSLSMDKEGERIIVGAPLAGLDSSGAAAIYQLEHDRKQ